MKKVLLVSIGCVLLLLAGLGGLGVLAARGILNNRFNWFDIKFLDGKKYIVLLQNNMEIRPSGGFLGSYAVVSTQKSGISEIQIQDIYVPDGQLVGHVDPPLPIQQAFGQGWWRLRDANWDVDFASAAAQIAWFFEQGGEPSDGIIAINLSLVRQLLTAFGPLKPVDYPEVTASNFYQLAQSQAETDFFPGSTQKRDFLGAVGREAIKKLKNLNPVQALKMAKIIYKNLRNQEILVWLKDRPVWGGLGTNPGNYLYIVDTNLGANKANCCIQKSVEQTENSLKITWENDNPFTAPKPPEFWGGDYVNWVRVVVPAETQIESIFIGNRELKQGQLIWQYGLQEDIYEVEERGEFKIIGFWAKVTAQQLFSAVISFQSPVTSPILIKKQPGVESFDYKLILNDQVKFDGEITRDILID